MKLIRHCLLLLVIALTNSVCVAYEQDTHRSLSLSAVEKSVLAAQSNNILSDFGLSTDISEFSKQKYPNSTDELKSIIELVQDGAYFEDNFSLLLPRPIHHFYDPINDQALQHPVLNYFGGTNRSPDWALDDAGDIPGQEYSYKNALDAFYKALTLPTKAERDLQWGRTFETLGHVIHHIQDMAQPEHVRNDLHCGIFWGCGLPGAIIGVYDPSWFELRSKRVFRDGIPTSLVNYPKVAFPTAREFWTTRALDAVVTDRKGLADFTNRNFISKDANFEIKNGVPAASSRYGLPVPSATNVVDLSVLDANGAGICQRLNQIGPVDLPPNSPCEVEFIENLVTDSYDPAQSGTNTRAASLSLFDQYLVEYNVNSVALEDGDTFHVMDVDRLLTINEYNIDAAHQFLIPRAVAYGAGLIDHFFRGKIDMAPDPGGAGWVIRNFSDEEMEGTFTLYYDYIDPADGIEKRAPIPGAVWSTNGPIAPGGQIVVGTYTAPSNGILSKTLVFSGRLGAENSAYAGKHFGGWGGPVLVASQNASFYKSATDSSGNSIVIYSAYDAATTKYGLWGQRYTPEGGWSNAALLSSSGVSLNSTAIAMDDNGNAIVVYTIGDHTTSVNSLWGQRYTPESGWGSETLLSGDIDGYGSLAMDANGSAIVAYQTYDKATSTLSLWSQHYMPGSGWVGAILLTSNNADNVYGGYRPFLAMSANGDATIVYRGSDPDSIFNLWSQRYTPGSGWGGEVLLASNNGNFYHPSLAMGANGEAMVVYEGLDVATTISGLRGRLYTPASGWTGEVLLTNKSNGFYYPSLVMGANGDAMVIYRIIDAQTSTSNLWGQHYTPGSGWSGAVLLSSGGIGGSLVMDANGNAIVTYYSATGNNVVARHYAPGSSWGDEILLSDGSQNLTFPYISMNANGNATVTWEQIDGAGNIQLWSNHYTP